MSTGPDFPLHDHDSVPDGGAQALDNAQKAFGFAPNLIRVLAEAPSAANAYLAVGGQFEESSLSPVEQQVVLLTTSFENGCDYCMAAHSTVATMVDMPDETLEALRAGHPLPDEKLEALRAFTTTAVRQRGHMDPDDLRSFLDAGYTRRNILEVITGIAMKTLSNYSNHIAGTPVDEQFEAQRWNGRG